VPVDLEALNERVVDSNDVGGNRSVVALEITDLKALVVEMVELKAKISSHVIKEG
jgi:hypothetical protein